MASTRSKLDEIVESFSTLEDPRSHINRRHPLPSILVLAVLAVLAGAAGPTAIARWAKFKEDLLTGLLDLPHGIPGKDVFRRVLMMLKPEAFEAAFNAWIARLRDEAAAETGVDRPIIAIDGKSARRSHDAKRTSAPCTSSPPGPANTAWPWAGGLRREVQRDHRDPRTAEEDRRPGRGGDDRRDGYPEGDRRGGHPRQGRLRAGPEGNHESLHRAVIEHIDEQLEGDLEGAEELTTTDRGHGREEERTYLQTAGPRGPAGEVAVEGPEVGRRGDVAAREGGRESIEVRYYLSSLPVDVKLFARAVRGHWSVENACHWTLDVTFREDDSRVRERVLGANITWLYRFTLSILKQHPDRRKSLMMKRRGCGWSDKFLMEVITALTC